MQERNFRLIFVGVLVALWLIGVYVSGMVSNWLVHASMLVAIDKPHVFSLPMSEYGMDFRTIGAVIGAGLVLYAAGFWCDAIEHDRDPIDDAPTAKSQVRAANQMDPMMGGMGMGMGGYPMGGMGVDPMMGGGFMPPDPMSPPPGKFS